MKDFFNKLINSEIFKTVCDRLHSGVCLSGIISQICIIISLISPTASETAKIVMVALLEIVTLLGIVNNPSDRGNL